MADNKGLEFEIQVHSSNDRESGVKEYNLIRDRLDNLLAAYAITGKGKIRVEFENNANVDVTILTPIQDQNSEITEVKYKPFESSGLVTEEQLRNHPKRAKLDYSGADGVKLMISEKDKNHRYWIKYR